MFSSLTRRILFFNIAATVVLVAGILYLNQFREGLIDARVESLLTQGEIIAGAFRPRLGRYELHYYRSEKLLEHQAGQSITPVPNDEELDFPSIRSGLHRSAPPDFRPPAPARAFSMQIANLLLDSRHLYSRARYLRATTATVKANRNLVGMVRKPHQPHAAAGEPSRTTRKRRRRWPRSTRK